MRNFTVQKRQKQRVVLVRLQHNIVMITERFKLTEYLRKRHVLHAISPDNHLRILGVHDILIT